ncbi:MAG TPA: alpha/beta fold hydrolase [Candidatus Binataceae bacterium]|nr:alpha/beta fold hydrolase [Candidatus Binataceae bacterium]
MPALTRTGIAREIATAGLLIASYPLDEIARRAERLFDWGDETVVLAHGLGGSRANFLAFAAYVRMAGFGRIEFFEYPRWQSVADSASMLSEMVGRVSPGRAVHIVGHSLGGTIARRFATSAPHKVRSLVTIGSPYSINNSNSRELAIFGEEDPIVPPPPEQFRANMFKRAEVLPATGHLAILYHPQTLRLTATELRLNRY